MREQKQGASSPVPRSYENFVHRQYDAGDTYGCALYAQSSVLEAMGFDFSDALAAAKRQGIAEGWYDLSTADGDGMGLEYQGLGQVFEANGITNEKMGAYKEWSGSPVPDQESALTRLTG